MIYDTMLKIWNHGQLFFIGLLGSLLTGVASSEKGIPIWKRAVFILIGAFCAHFLTGLVCDWFDISKQNYFGAAFLIGTFGASFIMAVIKALESGQLIAALTAFISLKGKK